jgi:long-chain acyl-CoA synthetase
MNGASTTYLDRPPSPAVLQKAMRDLRPTAMVSVPLFIEKTYRQTIARRLEKSRLYSFPLTRPLALHFAGRKLMKAFGGSMRFFGIGGAPMGGDVELFMRAAGFPYALGYGLTETAPLISGTRPFHFPFRSVGRVLKGVELRIAEDGEIQVRGPNVMMGYYHDEEATKAAFTEDLWFKTGDLGFKDKKGFLFIKGRIKALILGPSGENIYPEEIEGLLTSSTLVEDALVYSAGRGEIVASVVLSETAMLLSAINEGLDELKLKVNQKLAVFSRIHRIEIQKEPFEKTATLKIKRYLYPKPV